MPKLHVEPLLFCLAWALVAVAASVFGNIWIGLIVSLGLLTILMPVSATILTRYEDEALERQVRWGILVIAALALAIWLRS